MEKKIKLLYIKLVGKNSVSARTLEHKTIDNMLMYRTIEESSTQLNFNFVANQRAYDNEYEIFRFLVKHANE